MALHSTLRHVQYTANLLERFILQIEQEHSRTLICRKHTQTSLNIQTSFGGAGRINTLIDRNAIGRVIGGVSLGYV